MIPLLYILPKDDIFQSASGIVHEITPKYSNFRNTIQIEFKYNLDSYFYLEVMLSELDQPSAIKLYSGNSEYFSVVSDLEESYSLLSDEIVVVIKKDAILDIVNNIATYQTFHTDTKIDLKVIKPQPDIHSRPIVSQISNWGGGLSINIENEAFSYYDGGIDSNYQPILSSLGSGKILPYKAEYNYFFYDISDTVSGHVLLVAPPKDFFNHHLFRGANALSSVELLPENNIRYNSAETLAVRNGAVSHNNINMAFDRYIELRKDEEYKTYLFNAAMDGNLYTETSLLIPSVRHTGMSIYDFANSTLVRGSISQNVVIDSVSDSLVHSIKMSQTRDFFGNNYGYDFEFLYDPSQVFYQVRFDSIENLSEIGTLYKINCDTGAREVIPLTRASIQENQIGMISGSNNNMTISISRNRVSTFTKDRMQKNGLPKRISSTDSIQGTYNIRAIDYKDLTIEVSTGTKKESFSFSDTRVKSLLISEGPSSILSEEGASNIGGVAFLHPVIQIDFDFINVETFGDAVLLTRVAEDADYGIANIIRDCNKFMHHMYVEFEGSSLLFILNRVKDKIYYIEFNRKVVNTDIGNIDNIIDRLINIADDRVLKDFLLYHSMEAMPNKIKGTAQIISADSQGVYTRRIDSILMIKENLSLGRFSFIDGEMYDYRHIVNGTAGDMLYSPREYKNSEIVERFKKSSINFRPITNAILGNGDHEVEGLLVADGTLTINFSLGEALSSLSISLGGIHEFKSSLKMDINSGDISSEEDYPFDINSESLVTRVYQIFDMIIVEFATMGAIAFNFSAISSMIENQDVAILGSIMHSRQGYAILLRVPPIQSILFESFESIVKKKAHALYQSGSSDIVLDILCLDKWGEHLSEESDDEYSEIEVFSVSENGNMGVALPIEYIKFFQLKG